MTIYIGDVGTRIDVDCGTDISAATSISLKVKKPDNTLVTWNASIITKNGKTRYLRYVTQSGDIDQSGSYKVQASVTMPEWSGLGETATLEVLSAYS